MLNKKSTFVILTGLALLVGGCGQKGALYQTPKDSQNNTEKSSTQSKPQAEKQTKKQEQP
ncbi:LPS translocon maturation chaperone LptM [Thalassotalea sp. PS06]|uniref:LPS translocon maturation chaperone LptM n=1 Tax=Thalassotalea sp. PS06 TaxID=2594005 RepID=UPI0011628FBC|nr:lipoprotein [Thalassotalea sp. PS06]QDP02579.1 lipoprotein [Thalassotalea sp. PS06]